VGPRGGLDAVAKRKSRLCRESNHDVPARSLVVIPTELSRLPYTYLLINFIYFFYLLIYFTMNEDHHQRYTFLEYVPEHFGFRLSILPYKSMCNILNSMKQSPS
jgi:hypothetical protein